MLFIELRGVEFVNKGAELMLHAILQKIGSEFPEAKFVMEKNGRAPVKKQQELGILTKFKFSRYQAIVNTLEGLIPNSLLNSMGYVKESQVNIILDGSGFAFGDKWGARKAGARLANHVEKWKASGKKIILLPQAFGPFEGEEIQQKMKVIVENASIVFARDTVSYQYLANLATRGGTIIQRPDFTNLVKGSIPNYFDKEKYEVAIIPNSQMIVMGSENDKENYPSLLAKLIKIVQDSGQKPFFLIHEAQSDKKIAESVNKQLSTHIPVLEESNPLKVKGIIGASKAVITSRFHGLVSALSQATPCLTTGWSHKYEMLLKDYDYSEGMIDTEVSDDELRDKLKMILDPESSSSIKAKLESKSSEQKHLTNQMWEKVIETIKR